MMAQSRELIGRGHDLSSTKLTLWMVKLIMGDSIGGSWEKTKKLGSLGHLIHK